jgi:hypothetical protein
MIFFRFISVAAGLPKTSYVKMIDIWLIFNLAVPFMEVVMHDISFRNHHTNICRFFFKLISRISVARWMKSKK